MKPIDPHAFDRKQEEAAAPVVSQDAHMIRAQMNRRDWLILSVLALIWGGAFFFIGVAVKHVPPLTYVWLRLTIAAGAMWLFLRFKGQSIDLPREAWGSIVLLAVLNNALPFTLFGWGQNSYRERPRLDPECDHADLGRRRCPFPHERRADESRRSPASCWASAAWPP